MTFEALQEAIKRLIIKRMTADHEEQKQINTKLDKLYNIKYLMFEQQAKV